MRLIGRTWKFGRNINTDLIYPKTFFKASYAPGEMALHLMAGIDADFAAKVRPGDIIVGEPNFGCGSSREEAVGSMREAGIAAVVAPSFGRLFTRNCINLGIPVITSPAIDEHITEGDELEIDLSEGLLRNLRSGYEVRLPRMAAESLKLIESGGIKPYTERILKERRAQAAAS
jgi:3-isopropylmalate/(R)-2-methylmalate dehydratase small subunit